MILGVLVTELNSLFLVSELDFAKVEVEIYPGCI